MARINRLLVVEDDVDLSETLVEQIGLCAEFKVGAVGTAGAARDLLGRESVDLVIMDVGLPDMDGRDAVRLIREDGYRGPIIMLTAQTSDADVVGGLDAGANDYVPKPFKFDELLARVRSRLRENVATGTISIVHSDVRLDVLARRATVAGREIDLSAREFALAEQFLRHPGQVLSREQLLSSVWGLDFDPGSNVVDVYVRYLRTKFGHERITTVRGAGYRWE